MGEDKVKTNKKGEDVAKKLSESQVMGSKQVYEVTFENFFGASVKELFKVVFTYTAEKTAQCLLGPKLPVYGFEQVINSLDMKLVRSDPWEENQKSGSLTRKFIYSVKHMDNIFQNTEIIEQLQTYQVKK